MEKLKVIQWYTGEIARHQIRLIHSCPDLELVGAFVYHEDKVGKDVGVIAGIGELGVKATNNIDEILALEADCVLYNPQHERYDEIIKILESGKNVISIIAGWNPKKHPLYPEIERACAQGNSSLYGTGLNPGLSYEMAILASSVCSSVESIHIKTCEQQESLSPVFLEAFGFGRTEEDLRSGDNNAFQIFDNLRSVTDLIAESCGLPHDENKLDWIFEPCTKDYLGKINVAKGTMGGLLLEVTTSHKGVPVVTIHLRFILDDEYVSEEFLSGRPKQGWIEVDVKGTPGSRMTHEVYMPEDIIGTWATGTKAVNAIPLVVAAEAGLLSPLDLPFPRKLDFPGF